MDDGRAGGENSGRALHFPLDSFRAADHHWRMDASDPA